MGGKTCEKPPSDEGEIGRRGQAPALHGAFSWRLTTRQAQGPGRAQWSRPTKGLPPCGGGAPVRTLGRKGETPRLLERLNLRMPPQSRFARQLPRKGGSQGRAHHVRPYKKVTPLSSPPHPALRATFPPVGGRLAGGQRPTLPFLSWRLTTSAGARDRARRGRRAPRKASPLAGEVPQCAHWGGRGKRPVCWNGSIYGCPLSLASLDSSPARGGAKAGRTMCAPTKR